jgi:hypothetical protein
METITINRREVPQQQIYFQYDEEGNPIEGTETTFDYVMVYTLVEYNFPEYNQTVQVEITHFNPQSEEEIEIGISNRGITEQRKLTNK